MYAPILASSVRNFVIVNSFKSPASAPSKEDEVLYNNENEEDKSIVKREPGEDPAPPYNMGPA
jgi:hypothetical protein